MAREHGPFLDFDFDTEEPDEPEASSTPAEDEGDDDVELHGQAFH